MKNVFATRMRDVLLATSALVAVPGIAHAESTESRPDGAVEVPHAGPVVTDVTATPTAANPGGYSVETPHITINNNFTPVQAYDPANVTGIGQIISDAGGGFIGTCTGTLINRRTVIFAAHCVNNQAATSYGANTGGTAIGVGFETNTRANAPGQTDELVQWLLAGPNQYKTNTAQSFYNIRQVFWNPASVSATSCTAPGSCFLESDVALGVLDTPANSVPTWGMLFSPLNTPATIDPATGTGYHVTIAGYGAYGNGTTGASTNGNFRRRVAENMVGALTSLSDRNLFIFGTAGTPQRNQVLYFLDFDDPTRTNTRDFNGFRDNALPREGLTGPGDSGGPLILDQQFSRPVVIGVLSGGSTFYNGQTGGAYGTQSFYQPLFLTWDWIAANNPMRYVSAIAGNRNWEDATTWRTELDPNYFIINGTNLVNGVPAFQGAGAAGSTPKFGEYCFQVTGYNECQNIATGETRFNTPNQRNAADNRPDGEKGTGEAAAPALLKLEDASEQPLAGGYSDTPIPAATIANGLPGATNFVANNSDGNRLAGVGARYYDVTLREQGALSLSSAVTIDNLTIRGATSQLNVNTAGSLTSLFEINQLTGTVQNNGSIRSVGDYLLMSGLLTGSGRVTAPFLTNVLGTIAPGTMGTVGTLTVAGNLILSSGSNLMIDLGPNGTSDLLSVVRGDAANSGTANLGGTVTLTPTTGTNVRFNDLYTILTATGGITGRFNTPASISAILAPQFVYGTNAVQVRVVAGRYADVVANTPVQTAYARLLDNNRTNYAALSGLFGTLDVQNQATIRATLESWAPRTEALVYSLGTAAVENINRLYRGRIANFSADAAFDGQVAMTGDPLSLAATGDANAAMMPGAVRATADAGTTMLVPGRLPEGTRGFVAGGYLDGRGRSMQTAVPAGRRDDFDGWYVAGGIEARPDDISLVGFGMSYSRLKGTTDAVPQRVRGELVQGTLYGKSSLGGVAVDAMVSAGWLGSRTTRTAALGGTTYTLRSNDDSLAIATEVGLSGEFGETIKFGPRIAMRASNIGFSKTIETGGPMALFLDRPERSSAQGLAGLTIGGGTAKIRPYASAYYVHEFLDTPAFSGANFVGGIGPNSLFALNGSDRNWGEAALGLTLQGERVSFSVGADTTVWRKDVSNQAYRGSVSIRF